VVDKLNKRLLGYTVKGQLAKETFMESEPYAIAFLDANKFFCTVPSTQTIEIRDYGALQYAEKIDKCHVLLFPGLDLDTSRLLSLNTVTP
jgi:hypothetical protein